MDKEKELYLPKNKIRKFFKIISNHPDYIFYKAIVAHKKYRFAKENNKMLKMFFYGIKANKFASKYNLELYGKIGEKLKIWHGNIIINSNAVLGNNIQLHGNNCIGNNGKNNLCPQIGNNVDIGYGTVIIGNIKIANNVIIGANSFVNQDFLEEGVTIAGSPAKIIKRRKR